MRHDTKNRLRRVACKILNASGAVAIGRILAPPKGTVILYGHRVADDDEGYLEGLSPEWFDEQVNYLTRHYEIISLGELVSCYEKRRPVPAKAAVLTFDDGFRNNLEAALPILEKHHVTATVFLVTGCVTTGDLPWSQRLGYLFQMTDRDELELHPIPGRVLDLSTPGARLRAYGVVKEPLKAMRAKERERVIEAVQKALRVDPPRHRMVTWDLVREARATGLEFGAHTWSHPYLAMVPFDEARRDIAQSLEDIRIRLGDETPFFCFPAGSTNARLVDVVRSMGFRSAFQPARRRTPNTLANADQFSLRRFGLPNGGAGELAAELAGPLNAIRGVAHRVAGSAAL